MSYRMKGFPFGKQYESPTKTSLTADIFKKRKKLDSFGNIIEDASQFTEGVLRQDDSTKLVKPSTQVTTPQQRKQTQQS